MRKSLHIYRQLQDRETREHYYESIMYIPIPEDPKVERFFTEEATALSTTGYNFEVVEITGNGSVPSKSSTNNNP